MCLDLIRIASSFVSCSFSFFLFLLFSVKTKRNWILNQINSDYESCSEFHLLHVWFVVSSSFVSFSCSFLSPSVFSVVLFVLRSSFPFLIVKMFQFSDNLSDNLLLKKGPRRRDRLIWSQEEEGLNKKVNRFSTPGHHVVFRLGEPNALLHSYERFFFGTIGLYQIRSF